MKAIFQLRPLSNDATKKFALDSEAIECSSAAISILQATYYITENRIYRSTFISLSYTFIVKLTASFRLRIPWIKLFDVKTFRLRERNIIWFNIHGEHWIFLQAFSSSSSTKIIRYIYLSPNFKFNESSTFIIHLDSTFYYYSPNSNLVEQYYEEDKKQCRMRDMPDPSHLYPTVFKKTYLNTTWEDHFINLPNIRNNDGQLIMLHEYRSKLKDGSVVMVNVYLKLYVFFYEKLSSKLKVKIIIVLIINV
jgi:hypothetical protein